MKKLFKSNRLPMLSALCGSLLLLGCTNEDYDFDKVDYTLGFGSGDLVLPSNNSVTLKLDDILDLGNSDLITTESNGDYKLFKEPDNAINPVKVNIEEITITGHEERGLDYPAITLPEIPDAIRELIPSQISLPYHYEIFGQSVDIPVLEANGDISLLEYEFDADPAIKSLKYVEVGKNGKGVNLTLSLTIPTAVSKFGSLTIDLPDMLTMTCPSMANNFDKEKNVLTLTNYPVDGQLQIVFNVTRINVKTINENNFVKLENGKFKLKTTVGLAVSISELTLPKESTLTLSGVAKFDDLVITKACGIFDPDIDLGDVGTATINDIPDFLTDKDVVADIANPQIWLTLKSNMPLGGIVDAKITSDTYSKGIIINNIELEAKAEEATEDAETKIVICRHAPEDLNGYKAIEVEDLSKLIEKLQDGMKISFTATQAKAKQEEATVELGKDYYLKPEYRFSAALALGDNAAIVYSDKEVDWNKDIDKLELSDNSKILLTANVENGVPADLEINITPLDKNGKTLNTLTVTPIKNKIAAGATAGEIQYEISDASGKALKQLDGVDYRLKVTAPSDAAQKGKTLNKNQEIKIKDIKMQLNGKVIYDAN